MRHLKKKKTLDRKRAQRKALLRGLATSLVLHEKIKTTDAKAKALRPVVEKLVTGAKKGDLASRRALISYLYAERAAKKMIEVIAPRYSARNGGYLRISKLGARPLDGANIVEIAFV